MFEQGERSSSDSKAQNLLGWHTCGLGMHSSWFVSMPRHLAETSDHNPLLVGHAGGAGWAIA
jgi:hypothetical protein